MILIFNGASSRQDCGLVGPNQVPLFVWHQCGGMGSGHVRALWKEGRLKEALHFLDLTRQRGFQQYLDTCMCLLEECINLKALKKGKQVHAHIVKRGFQSNILLGNALVNMYVKCGSIEHACQVFHELPERNNASWTAIIAGCSQYGYGEEALKLFWQMQEEQVKPNCVTFTNILKACTDLMDIQQGREIHSCIVKVGAESHLFVSSALINMYAKCGSICQARQIFDKMRKRNVVSWTAMISGYAQHGHVEEALKLFWQMHQECIKPDNITFASILKACASKAALEHGREIHASIIKNGFESDVLVGSTLVDMYAKCGTIDHARHVFDKMPDRNVVSWTAMISGYAHHGHGAEALKLFRQMQQECLKPNRITYISALKACACVAALEHGKQIHACIVKSGSKLDVSVGNTLVDMYAKCGSLESARQVFNTMHERDVVSWTVIISGYAHHGHGQEAVKLFEQMQQECVKPSHITFIGVLTACSHSGLVDAGRNYFKSMNLDHSITPTGEHYACMVDLLSRAGHLDEASNFIQKMAAQPTAAVWTALLGACRVHDCVELAKHVTECIIELEPQCPAAFVLLSNMYAAVQKWDDMTNVRKVMEDRGVKKKPGHSCVEVNDQVHTFIMGDTSHPQTEEIHAELKRLSLQMVDAGYVPDTCFVLHDVEEHHKEASLYHHSEKLAIAFGLINTSIGTPIRIIKNLRVCGDCHTATKFISKIVWREVVVRDASRFHHFKDGVCSCGDYW